MSDYYTVYAIAPQDNAMDADNDTSDKKIRYDILKEKPGIYVS